MSSRALAVALLLILPLTGCRAPAIPAQPSAREYAVWHDVIAFEADSVHPQAVVVVPETLRLDEAQLQFQRCLPPHMRDIFDDAPTATLSPNVPEDWLRMKDTRSATLGSIGSVPTAGTTMFLRLSRVAFSRFGRDGYVWAEHRSCTTTGASTHCEEREGKLLHVIHDEDHWTARDTDCVALALGNTD